MSKKQIPHNSSRHRSWMKKIAFTVLPLCLVTSQMLYAKDEAFSDETSEEQFVEQSDQTLVSEEAEEIKESEEWTFAINESSAMQTVYLQDAQIQQYVPKINVNAPAKTLGAKDIELVLKGIQELETRSTLSRQLKQYPVVAQLENLDRQQRQTLKDNLFPIQPYLEKQPVHSIYNPNTGEHLLSTDTHEVHDLEKMGWRNEGIIFGSSLKNGVPVYRFYQKSTGHHRYTSKQEEMEQFKANGWSQDNTVLYASSIDGKDVYQIQNPNDKRIALTPDLQERQTLLNLGWIDLGIGFKVVPYASVVALQQNNQNVLQAYDCKANPIVGTLKMRTLAAYFDPENEGKMSSGYIDVLSQTQTGELITEPCYRLYLSDGKMAVGEQAVNNQIHYFDLGDGHMIRDQIIRYGADRSAYYYDQNGVRFTGSKEYKGRRLEFDGQSGKLINDTQKLMNRLTQYIEQNKRPGETYSLALRLPDAGEQYMWQNGVQQSASTMKLFVMGAIYENYETYIARFGKSAIDNALYAMITVSDNEGWKYLTSVLGGGSYAQGVVELTNWCKQHGYNQTRMENRAYGNFTSVHDSSKILQDIYLDKLRHSQAMENLICQQRVPGRLLAGIPASVKTGNKAGWLSNTSNDSVIVWLDDGVYILSLMATDLVDYNNCLRIMQTVSNQTYIWMQEHYNGTTPVRESQKVEQKSKKKSDVKTDQELIKKADRDQASLFAEEKPKKSDKSNSKSK